MGGGCEGGCCLPSWLVDAVVTACAKVESLVTTVDGKRVWMEYWRCGDVVMFAIELVEDGVRCC